MLVGQRVRQLVDQGGALLNAAARAFQYEQLLLVVVVKGGGLLGEKIHRILPQIEAGRNQAQHLEGQFFRMQVGRFEGFLDALFQEDPELFFIQDSVGDHAGEWESGDAGKARLDSSDFRKEYRGLSGVKKLARVEQHRGEQKQREQQAGGLTFHARIESSW